MCFGSQLNLRPFLLSIYYRLSYTVRESHYFRAFVLLNQMFVVKYQPNKYFRYQSLIRSTFFSIGFFVNQMLGITSYLALTANLIVSMKFQSLKCLINLIFVLSMLLRRTAQKSPSTTFSCVFINKFYPIRVFKLDTERGRLAHYACIVSIQFCLSI